MQEQQKQRVSVYIDGFNFYYGLKRMKAAHPEWKKFYWLDFVKFFDHFKQENQVIQKVYYFTTPPLDDDKVNRQSLLFKANRLINGNRFETIRGKFYEKELICPVCRNRYTKPEEKRTDVNICARMMLDCAQENTDVLFLVTADSDLMPPLALIKRAYPDKTVKVFFPPKGFSNDINNFMQKKVVKLQNNKVRFQNSVMPNVVAKDDKSYTIPPEWNV